MYLPESFKVADANAIREFMKQYEFATIVSNSSQGLTSTHAPVLVREQSDGLVVVGHVARENPHLQMIDNSNESLVIFHGPHHYVSPSWYVNSPAVPTWNYVVVHAYGQLRARPEREFIEGVLRELVSRHEANRSKPWRIEGLPPAFYQQFLSHIIGFEVRIERTEAKFKLGQNRPAEDRVGTIEGLTREGSKEAETLADFMKSHFQPK